MTSATRRYTTAEAAVLSGLAIKAVHNAIDKRIVERTEDRRRPRSLSAHDILRLKLWHEVGAMLSQERRQHLFAEIERRPAARRVKADALVIVDVGEARRQVARQARTLEAAEAAVRSDKAVMNGEPVFAGTRVPVRMVAAMLDQGADEAEILDGYPSLDPRHLTLARVWTAANPRRGRPRKPDEPAPARRGQR